MGEDPGELVDVARRVAGATLTLPHFEREDWQKAVFLNGLTACGGDDLDAMCRKLVDRVVDTQTTAGQYAYGSMDRAFQMRLRDRASASHGWWSALSDERFLPQTNTAALGLSVLDWYERTGEERYLASAQHQLDRLLGGNRTTEGAITQYSGVPYLFVDAIYMICPFLARFGRITGRREVGEEAIAQFRRHTDRLFETRTNLYRHVWCERPDHYPQSAYWGRGNGWVVAALADVLGELIRSDFDVDELVAFLTRFADSLVARQDRSGLWHNIVDDPNSWLETSGTALIAYGLQGAVDLGVLDPSYGESATAARRVLAGAVDGRGHVTGVAGVPGGQEALPEVNPTGQGAWLLAMSFDLPQHDREGGPAPQLPRTRKKDGT